MLFGKKVKYFGLVMIIFVALLGFAGCSSNEEPADNGEENGEEVLSGSITVVGSTSVTPVSELLAEAFMDIHPETTIYVQGGGSTVGVVAAIENTSEIGQASRNLKAEEEETGIKKYTIASDGIAVVANPACEVDDLTIEQISDIFAGKITNWSEVGGPDVEIVAVTREEGSGTRGAFESMVMDEEISSDTIVQDSQGAVKTTVEGDENAIGYISLAAVDNNVKALAVNGALPTTENIASGEYVVARPFLYLTHEAPTGLTKEFIDFVMGKDAQGIIQEAGLISIN